MGDCFTKESGNDFLVKNENIITGNIADFMRLNSPWLDVVEKGVWKSGISDVQRSVVQKPAISSASMCNPVWSTWNCDRVPTKVQMGTVEFQYQPEVIQFKSDMFCVTQVFSALKGAVMSAEKTLKQFSVDNWNARIRAVQLNYAATKITVRSDRSLDSSIATGFQTNFLAGLSPNAPLTWAYLEQIVDLLENDLLAGPDFRFGDGQSGTFRFISDSRTIARMRDESGVRDDMRWIAASGNDRARKALTVYDWEGPYRDVSFGKDQSSLRVSAVNPDGSVVCVEPFESKVGSTGTPYRVQRPQYREAPMQISFLVARGTTRREIPEEYLGEALQKYQKQFWGGDVLWINNPDMDCNPKGDKGFYLFDLAAAFRPEYPEFIIPILHTRCLEGAPVSCDAQYYIDGSEPLGV